MIDLHAHVLPGLDDGPADVPGAVALARAAVAAGTQVMAATPHIDHRHGVDALALPGLVAGLAAELARQSIPLTLRAGGELAPERALDLSVEDLDAIALGDGGCVLLECPFSESGTLISNLHRHIAARGHRILLAHPERSPTFVGRPERIEELIDRGAFVQVTAASLLGHFGRTVERFSRVLLERGLVHVVASDAHDARGRAPVAPAVLAAAGLGDELVEFLTDHAPAALLDGRPVPAPPLPPPRRRLFGVRRCAPPPPQRPRPETMCGIVRRRILRSLHSDQLAA